MPTIYDAKYAPLLPAVEHFITAAGMVGDANFRQVATKAIKRQIDGEVPTIEAWILADWRGWKDGAITSFGVHAMLTEALTA